MSSMQEKLDHFTEVILKDAASERNRILERIRTEMAERLRLEKLQFHEQADALLLKETAGAEIEKNSRVSRAILEGRQLLLKTREDITDAVFALAIEKLQTFVRAEAYFPYLSALIRQSCRQAGEGELVIYLNRRDMELFSVQLEAMKKELPGPVEFRMSDRDILGGCQVFNRTRCVLLNNSLLESLEAQREGFFELCGLKIE